MDKGGDFLIAWADYRNGHSDIWGQYYDPNGVAISSNFKINSDTGLANQRDPSIILCNMKIYTAWQDDRIPGQNWDIFANVLLMSTTEVENTLFPSDPDNYVLFQNYPNPFNPITKINFELPYSGYVSLKIYNLSGQLMRTLVDEQRAAGHQTVHWDGRDENGRLVVSGLYLYKMKATEFEETKKMMMLK